MPGFNLNQAGRREAASSGRRGRFPPIEVRRFRQLRLPSDRTHIRRGSELRQFYNRAGTAFAPGHGS